MGHVRRYQNRRRAAPVAAALALVLGTALGLASPAAAQPGGAPGGPGGRTFGAREVLAAFQQAYPGRFSAPREVGGDWGIELDGRLFLYAGGRLLPAGADGKAASGATLDPQPFYPYPRELPPFAGPSAEDRARMEALLSERDRHPLGRDSTFLDRLWGIGTEEEAWSVQKRILFLSKEVLVHRDLLEEVARVEADLVALAATDPEVAAWTDGLGDVSCYYWKRIAGTASRSYHAYGAALDLVPKRSGGRAWYWYDARQSGQDWLGLPPARRISVPRKVVAAFEARGFVWGGKWVFWDLVHFEYRPEILILNGLAPALQARLP